MEELTLFKNELNQINPLLDFTEDCAYVAVCTFTKGDFGEPERKVAIITSKREMLLWDNKTLPEKGIFPVCESPGNLLEVRLRTSCLEDYLGGVVSSTTAEVYYLILEFLKKYVGFEDIEYKIVALWCMGTYLRPLFNAYPILYFHAPYESGKSRALELVSHISFNGKKVGMITPASFRRYADTLRPTLCIDELEELGLKNDSLMEPVLLNAFQSGEALLSDTRGSGNGWRPTLFKIINPVAIGNINGIRNEALQSRVITIPMQYNPNYKDVIVPKATEDEVCEIRDSLYCWFLDKWHLLKNRYNLLTSVEELSSREWEAYRPLVTIANFIDFELPGQIIEYAIACKQKKLITKRASDNRLELLYFIKAQFSDFGTEHSISNKELAQKYNDHIGGRMSYKDFADKISQLDVLKDAKNHHGVKVYYFDLERINQQIELIEAKA